MRRQDREVTDLSQIEAVIRSCDCCRIAFSAPAGAYIVPMNFAYEPREPLGVFYFHGAGQGRKVRLIAEAPTVGFELDCDHALKLSERACGYSFFYKSVIGTGVIRPVSDAEEKAHALCAIMRHYSPQQSWAFTPAQTESVAVFRLDVQHISCKIHQ